MHEGEWLWSMFVDGSGGGGGGGEGGGGRRLLAPADFVDELSIHSFADAVGGIRSLTEAEDAEMVVALYQATSTAVLGSTTAIELDDVWLGAGDGELVAHALGLCR